MLPLILIEPEKVFAERLAHAPSVDAFAFTTADAHIRQLFAAGPMPLMTLLNRVSRMAPARSKRVRLSAKRHILHRIGTLIRDGKLRRIRRTFVATCRVGPQLRQTHVTACDNEG